MSAYRKQGSQTFVQGSQDGVSTDEEWNAEVIKEQLLVVDVHSQWCGPCKAILPTFRRLAAEHTDRPLRFLAANADALESFQQYRGRSQPLILVYKSGRLVESIYGPDVPRLVKVVNENLPPAEESTASAQQENKDAPDNDNGNIVDEPTR